MTQGETVKLPVGLINFFLLWDRIQYGYNSIMYVSSFFFFVSFRKRVIDVPLCCMGK